MRAIKTKYLAPTNHRGARIRASAYGVKSIIVNATYNMTADQEHQNAAYILCQENDWKYALVSGQLDADTHAHILNLNDPMPSVKTKEVTWEDVIKKDAERVNAIVKANAKHRKGKKS